MSEIRARLKTLRDGLLKHHKSLLDLERAAYERDIAPIKNPGEYLNLVLEHPSFQWLRELSTFIVTIDEALAQKEPPLSPDEGERLLKTARVLVAPSEHGNGFAKSYFDLMQRDAAAVLAHRDMLQVLDSAGA